MHRFTNSFPANYPANTRNGQHQATEPPTNVVALYPSFAQASRTPIAYQPASTLAANGPGPLVIIPSHDPVNVGVTVKSEPNVDFQQPPVMQNAQVCSWSNSATHPTSLLTFDVVVHSQSADTTCQRPTYHRPTRPQSRHGHSSNLRE